MGMSDPATLASAASLSVDEGPVAEPFAPQPGDEIVGSLYDT